MAWANFFSPDRQGFNQPDLLAYTASFGGGFSATISAEMAPSRVESGVSAPAANASGFKATVVHVWTHDGSSLGFLGSATQDGSRFPDFVGSSTSSRLGVRRTSAGVAHNVRAAGPRWLQSRQVGLGGRCGRVVQHSSACRQRDRNYRLLVAKRDLVLGHPGRDVG